MFLKKLFKKKENAPKLPAGLSAKEQKQVLDVIRRAQRKSSVPVTAQDSIPFIQMFNLLKLKSEITFMNFASALL